MVIISQGTGIGNFHFVNLKYVLLIHQLFLNKPGKKLEKTLQMLIY